MTTAERSAAPPHTGDRRDTAKRWLLTVAALLWVQIWFATGVAVWHKRTYGPYSFGDFGQGHPNDVLGDVITGNGSAISPPLYVWVIFTLAILLATRSGRLGTVGVAALGLLGLLMGAGYLVEPFGRHALTPGNATFPETVLVVLSLILTASMTVLAGIVLFLSRRSIQSPPADVQPRGHPRQ